MEQPQQKADPPFVPASPYPLAAFEIEAIAQISDGDIEGAIGGASRELKPYLRARLYGPKK